MRKSLLILAATLAWAGSPSVQAAGPDKNTQALVNQYIKASFLPGENQDLSRLNQDATIVACNQFRDRVPDKIANEIVERETASIKYPADGKLMGDWKTGQKYYTAGFAYRIGRIEPDNPNRDRGGNCYACHAADPKEVAFGTLGPSLMGYGKLRGTSDEVIKYTYEKIYNSQAFTACSQMPRLGHNGILTPEKISHIVAFLLSPDSPVNK